MWTLTINGAQPVGTVITEHENQAAAILALLNFVLVNFAIEINASAMPCDIEDVIESYDEAKPDDPATRIIEYYFKHVAGESYTLVETSIEPEVERNLNEQQTQA